MFVIAKSRRLGLSAVGLLVLMPSIVAAQASLQIPLEFDFLNPGARSLALGSAFVGLADDASAAQTNPAGLTALTRPEVSFEGRGQRRESRFLERGRLSGTLTNAGIDTVTGPAYATSSHDSFGPGFLSFVYPGRRMALAVYRHELTEVNEQFATQGVFQSDVRELALTAARELTIATYGLSVAVRATQSLSVGAGISVADFSMNSEFVRYVPCPECFTSAASYDATRAVFRATQTGDDTGLAASVGLLWTPPGKFQVGLVFRKNAAFDFEQSVQEDLSSGPIVSTRGTFQVPDILAVGAVMRPNDQTMLAFEYTNVQYSSLKDDFIAVQARPSERQDRFDIDDGNELHVGFEYTLVNVAKTPTLRAGYWFDPAHSVVYSAPASADNIDQRFKAYLPGEKGLSHFTFGAGLAISARFEINGAADVSSRRKFYSVFAVGRL